MSPPDVYRVSLQSTGADLAAHRAAIASLPEHWRLVGLDDAPDAVVLDDDATWPTRADAERWRGTRVLVLPHHAAPSDEPTSRTPEADVEPHVVVATPFPTAWPEVSAAPGDADPPLLIDSRIRLPLQTSLRSLLIAQLASLHGVAVLSDLRVVSSSARHYVITSGSGSPAVNLVGHLAAQTSELVIDVVGSLSRRRLSATRGAPARPAVSRLDGPAGAGEAMPVYESHLRVFWRELHDALGGKPWSGYTTAMCTADQALADATLATGSPA